MITTLKTFGESQVMHFLKLFLSVESKELTR